MDAYELIDLGIKNIYRETVHASVNSGVDVLHALGHNIHHSRHKHAVSAISVEFHNRKFEPFCLTYC